MVLTNPQDQKVFEEALSVSKAEINSFYKEDIFPTHYILFLEYLRLSKMIGDLKGIDFGDIEMDEEMYEEMNKILEYVIKRMPHKETLGEVVSPNYFPDASEMMRYMNMSQGELKIEKEKLFNKTGIWNT